MKLSLFIEKWLQPVALFISLLCVALYAYTDSYYFLVAPFALLYLVLLTVNWKLAYWILLFSIPASVQLQFFNDTLSTSLPDEPLMWLFLLLFALMYFHKPTILPEWWWRNPLVLIVFVQYIWLIVAVVYSEEQFISIKFLLAKTWFLVSFFILPILVIREKKDFKTAFLVMLIPLLITMLIIFYRHKQIGFNFRKIEKAIHNIYYNHVDYSTVMSMFYPLTWVAWFLTKGKSWFIRIPLLLIIIFFLPAIYFTYARAAMIAIVFALAVGIAIKMRLVNIVMPTIYALVIALIIFLARDNKYIEYRPIFRYTYMHKKFSDHIAATLKGEDMSSMERLYRWIAAVRMSRDRPITGVGPNSFYYFYKPYAVSSFRTYVSRNIEHSTTHNYFLYMLVEQGWPAMILYAILVFAVFYQSQKIYHRFNDQFYRYVTLGVAMMFAAGFINNFFSELLETHKVGALFYLSIALLVILDRKSKTLSSEGEIAIAH